jgi:UDP-N-acetylglucosamine 3-dehydrogenase
MANLRAGLIGLGSMGRNHARVLRAIDGVDLVAIADPGGDTHGVAGDLEVLPDIESLIKVGVDYCVVAVPTVHHEPVGTALAEAGVAALIEKPLAVDGDAAQRLTAVFEKHGVVAGVGHIERYNPSLQSLRTRLANGEVGEVYQIATRRQGPFPNRIADVGVVKDLATHDIDLTAWVAGSSFVAISARTALKSGRSHEDLVAAVGLLADGTVTNHLVNWLSPMKERLTVVTGERGTFVADTLTADLTFFANGTISTEWDAIAKFRGVTEGDMVRFAIAKPEPLRTEHEAFRDAVLGLDSDIVTLAQGSATVAVADAALLASREGITVTLDNG